MRFLEPGSRRTLTIGKTLLAKPLIAPDHRDDFVHAAFFFGHGLYDPALRSGGRDFDDQQRKQSKEYRLLFNGDRAGAFDANV